jgi:precorrin-8X/cobalt-precorrin-8 methylmutase
MRFPGEGGIMTIIWDPREIEKKSMEMIESYLSGYSWSPLEKAVVKRVIHTTGDPDMAGAVRFHPGAAEIGLQALRSGKNVFTDVNMLKAGINSQRLNRWGGRVFCSVSDPRVVAEAQKLNITRAAASMRGFGAALDGAIVAIGNAPTALFELLNLIEQGVRPAFIVGTPVGFVGAAESKEMLIKNHPVPFISLAGTRGGSPVAASMINALLYFEREGHDG